MIDAPSSDALRFGAWRPGALRKTPAKTPTVAILGAGFSGLGMAIRLRQEGIETFTVYEKAHDVGGAWRENTYPGVACDVPSHLYSFSFEPNPNWSSRFSPGGEIYEYTKHCARKYDLYRSIQFGKTVTGITHDAKQWRVAFADGSCVKADYVVSGLGGLHVPNIAEIAGRDDFKGPLFHSAQWRHDVDLTGKRVAVIGSAASAVQIIPQLAPAVSRLDIYQRTPNWIMPRRSYAYPDWIKKVFATTPRLARAYRGLHFSRMEWGFGAFKKDNNLAKRMAHWALIRHMSKRINDPVLRAKLTPDYPIGCKRILISDDYLPALQRDNVDLITDPIEAITATGVKTADRMREVDVIIMATGFRPFDILESIEVIGPSGRSLGEAWKGAIAAHRTIAVPGFPNFFMLLGPNSGLGHNSIIMMIEAQVNYVIKLVRQAMARDAAYVEPSPDAAAAFDARLQNDLKERVWAANCGAWYVGEDGRNFTLYPHNVRAYLREMCAPDEGEYVFSAAPEPEPARRGPAA